MIWREVGVGSICLFRLEIEIGIRDEIGGGLGGRFG